MSQSANLIIGGEMSKRNQFPWIAIVSVENDDIWSHQGSGSLISNRHVLVDAKSVSYTSSLNNLVPVTADRVNIFLGTTSYDDLSAPGSIKLGVIKITNHPNARELLESLDVNRISIITLERRVTFTEFIRPVCLWPYGDNLNEIIGRDAYAVGYGSDDTGNDTLVRKQARMIVTEDEICRNNFSDEFDIGADSAFFCVKGRGNEGHPCYLDNQLYIKISSKWYIRGISSTISTLDDDNCDVNAPALYEDVAPFKSWIEAQLIGK